VGAFVAAPTTLHQHALRYALAARLRQGKRTRWRHGELIKISAFYFKAVTALNLVGIVADGVPRDIVFSRRQLRFQRHDKLLVNP